VREELESRLTKAGSGCAGSVYVGGRPDGEDVKGGAPEADRWCVTMAERGLL
jgi:hypothetical protein